MSQFTRINEDGSEEIGYVQDLQYVWEEHIWVSFILLFIGFVGLITSPYFIIKAIWFPKITMTGSRNRQLFFNVEPPADAPNKQEGSGGV